ncbi:hypothetical protein A1F94_013464 [Pyrenophora tritici-repentis]|nr:hypothetical protein A1F94_013464 [Pyrenophora tritici-repentis]KAI1671048.1 hypothetical protein L13192_04405 [Pyrenophora tritici-repentis]KAI1684791.1 hypothetical protein KJE20_05075 [Pyrenophora tritici-repentis]
MAPKKDAPDGHSNALLVGFTDKDTKLLAAAFYDYDLMATLTKNTAGSLKKMWPPVKKKASENYPSFAALLGQAGTATTATEPKTPKKRKAAVETPKAGDVMDDAVSERDKADSSAKSPVAKKVKKVPVARGKGRAKKVVKKEASESEADLDKEDSANGDDGQHTLAGFQND